MITPSISTPIDVNTSIYFTAPQGYFSYTWSGDVTGTGYQSNTVSFTTPGTYTVNVLICDEFGCCGRYSYTFEVVNECEGVTITSSSNSCTDITVTVTGGTGTKTYKVEGPYGTDVPLTSLPGGGVFTIDTSNVLAGETISIVVTVYIDNGVEICTKKLTISYTRCACICDDDNTCKAAPNGLTLITSGGDPGFQRDIGVYQAGTTFNWYFDAQAVSDRLEIEYNGQVILDTGRLTRFSNCHCNGGNSCYCSDIFLGDVAQSSAIQIPVAVGFMNVRPVDLVLKCSEDITQPRWVTTASAPGLSPLVTYSVYGSVFLDPLIALEGLVKIKITGNVCPGSTSTTAWTFGMTCG
jgi:hypothetical protein